jgi:hypothetical protein
MLKALKGVKAKSHRLLTNNIKVLEGGHVNVEVSGPACVAIAPRSKGIRRRCPEGAHTVVNTGSNLRYWWGRELP